ncbi:MAG TPA: hypothetical protein VHG33_02300, partial [Woeseiaceae bacterium]|nr:hypothetical protein [Woeseiaceae bacterium]
MQHKLTPVPGARSCVPYRASRISAWCVARSIGCAVALLAFSATSLAQVIVSIEASDDTASETGDRGEFT